MSSCIYSYSYFEVEPTLADVKNEICNIVGLPEIKSHLSTIVREIYFAEKRASSGYTIIHPKPFHMVFMGNPGTGKSMVARILGKLFFLAGALAEYNIIEMHGRRERIKQAKGRILLVNADEIPENSETLEEIISAMDSGETSVIFAGQRKQLNRCMLLNKELYKRLSVAISFSDLSCEELASILTMTMSNSTLREENDMIGYKLDYTCNVDMVSKIIQKGGLDKQRSDVNGHLVGSMLYMAKKVLNDRCGSAAGGAFDRRTITLADLETGLRNLMSGV